MEVRGQLHSPATSAPGTHRMRGLVGPRAGIDIMEKKNISCPYWESNPDSAAIQPVAYTDTIQTYVSLHPIFLRNETIIYPGREFRFLLQS
jgi:hypothetical protein